MTYHTPKLKASRADGPVVPQSVTGRYRRIKWWLLAFCLTVYYGLPFLRWDRGPGRPDQAILLDLADVRFHFFGLEIRPQELYYLTGGLVLATMVLVLLNALAGRVWCGFFCPQTVWTDLFLLVERKIEGDRRDRLRALDAPLTPRRVGLIALKHAVWLLIAAGTGGAFVLYFADAPTLLTDAVTGQASSVAYGMILTLTLTTYGLAGFGREKVCTWMCPWPRLQGAIWDPEALTVNYRDYRGEARMSAKKAAAARAAGLPAGDCVDCNACVAVCPMGIDIRQGPSIACINCGLCVDACDTTMFRIDRERGLIDFDSWTNLERGRRGEERRPARVLRPKTAAIAVAIVALSGGMALSVATRSDLAVGVTHERTPVAVALSDGRVRNAFEVRVTNTLAASESFELRVEGAAPATLAVATRAGSESDAIRIEAGPDETRKVRVSVFGGPDLAGGLTFRLTSLRTGATVTVADRFSLP
ncbi:cytochrome c oxidase accessory protein CcoG [Chthonobacter albigriseus]|uniref:cytochrome c oxidase accessory protein CcoG n=1 Tax=Chthonobacter albigriseus TaxID=1683161 RepID=UPI0015EEFC41